MSVLKPGVVHTNERFDRAPTFILGPIGKLLVSSLTDTDKGSQQDVAICFQGLTCSTCRSKRSSCRGT